MKHSAPGFTSGAVAILLAVFLWLLYAAMSGATMRAVPSPAPGPVVAHNAAGGAR